MGKTRTAVISGAPDLPAVKPGEPKKKRERKKQKKSLREKKGVRIPGLKGGERIVAVDAGPLPEKEERGKEERKVEKRVKPPKVRGKKYKEARAKVDKTKLYPIDNAIKLVKETSYSSFDGTVDMHLIVKKEGFSVNVELPYPTGKKRKIEIADKNTVEKLKKGEIDFDVLLATAEMMPKLVPFAKTLGPRGLMPNPKTGTIIKDLKDAKKFSANTLTLKTEKKAPIIHVSVGKVSQKDKELIENTESILSTIGKRQILKAYLASTMGPSVKLDLS